MSNHINHPFHLVDKSPWPLVRAFRVFSLVTGIAKWFHTFSPDLFLLGTITTMLIIIQWWRDVTREGTFQGHHTSIVGVGLRWGIILFITSEVLFFFSFFWAFFHRRLAPAIELGAAWPPIGITPFNPFEIPILNTTILLASGVSVTWAHHGLIENNFSQTTQGLVITILLGFYFTCLQALEYWEAPFCIADGTYGSTFFIATGFHGIHVIVGTIFLFTGLIRHLSLHFSQNHHFGFEAAAWYWHFVDVVWLFLFISIYWWGNYFFSIQVCLTSNQGDHFMEEIMITFIPFIITLILIISLMILLALTLAQKTVFNREKRTPFECGFDPNSKTRLPFSLRFFIITILFLIFDVEIALLLPSVVVLASAPVELWYLTTSIFVIVLIFGLFYEYSIGILEWTLWDCS